MDEFQILIIEKRSKEQSQQNYLDSWIYAELRFLLEKVYGDHSQFQKFLSFRSEFRAKTAESFKFMIFCQQSPYFVCQNFMQGALGLMSNSGYRSFGINSRVLTP